MNQMNSVHTRLSYVSVDVYVYVPPLPTSLKELRDRITHALQTVTAACYTESGTNSIIVWMCVV
jgi:hypothetical protein